MRSGSALGIPRELFCRLLFWTYCAARVSTNLRIVGCMVGQGLGTPIVMKGVKWRTVAESTFGLLSL
jgi:hypothetical protein